MPYGEGLFFITLKIKRISTVLISIVTSTGLALFIGVQWLLRLLMVNAAIKKRDILTPASRQIRGKKIPKISVIVAAKDEEENIETCVTTLLNQTYPNFELIVIDDRSEDRTLEILRKLEKNAQGQLKVLHVDYLPEGWFGKSHAMQKGVAVSTGEWLCFLDADCQQTSDKTLSVAMQEALQQQTDFLTITPTLEMKTSWERLIQPSCIMALLVWFQPKIVNNPKSKTAYANGAFMLMKRSCYKAIGEHHRVKSELNEDILLAHHTKEAGLSLRMVENEGLYQTRMYDTLSQAWHGWSRIFSGSLRSTLKLSATVFAILFFSLLPLLCLAAAIGMRMGATEAIATQWNFAIGMWSAVVLLSYLPNWKFYSFLPIKNRWSLAYPIGALFTVMFLSFALLKHWGFASTLWRGTVYQFHGQESEQAEQENIDIAA